MILTKGDWATLIVGILTMTYGLYLLIIGIIYEDGKIGLTSAGIVGFISICFGLFPATMIVTHYFAKKHWENERKKTNDAHWSI